MPLNISSSLIDIWSFSATKGRYQRALKQHSQPQPSANKKASKKGNRMFMTGDSLEAPPTEPSAFNEQGTKHHLRPLGTVEVVLKLEDAHLKKILF